MVVADGFSGNVMLKTIEGVGSFMGKELKGMFLSSLKTKIAALLVKNGLAAFKERLNPDTIGGTLQQGPGRGERRLSGRRRRGGGSGGQDRGKYRPDERRTLTGGQKVEEIARALLTEQRKSFIMPLAAYTNHTLAKGGKRHAGHL